MEETLLTGSRVWLLGKVMSDITLNTGADRGKGALAKALKGDAAALARIYAFGFEGQLVALAKPALFLVHGDGESGDDPAELGLSVGGFSLPADLRAWEYDRADMTLRLDIMTGTFDTVLINYELGADGLQDYVRGGGQVGAPSPLGPNPRRGRGRRWRSDDE